MNKIYGLIGGSLGHSFSPQIHKALGGYDYGLYPMDESEAIEFVKARRFDGINVTIPYKQTVIPYLDRISPEAKEIGSVNTVVKESDGTLSGYNTDYTGFVLMLKKGDIDVAGKKALVLGSGGASKTAVYALQRLGASDVVVISRSGKNNYDNIEIHADAEIIVNTTPVGMFPKNGISPVELSRFSRLTGAVDLIYNPEKTEFLMQAERLGVKHIGGLYMLVAQAAEASAYFTKNKYTEADIDDVYKKVDFDMRNITLVGMPGCGKSTVGRNLAKLLGRRAADCDEEFEKKYGRTPASVITEDGEAEFRRLETEVLKEVSACCGLVVCTGGGVVTVSENHSLLRQNGSVVFINRDISLLATDGRPLSVGGADALKAMYAKRLPMYRSVCDFEIATGASDVPEETAKKIISLLK